MKKKCNRIVLAGTNSGCGKTTISCAILQSLVNRGMKVGAFKCGPDYIDPMFHSSIIGAKSRNLDPFFFDDNLLRYLFAKNAEDCDINVIEGVMGFYDGLSLTSVKASTCEVAEITNSPTVLILNAKGASLSVLAVIEGFVNFHKNNICGVILNQCTASTYQTLANAITDHFGGKITPLGFMPTLTDATLGSRHLGLITAEEISDLKEKLAIMAEQAEKTIDIPGLIALADSAGEVEFEPVEIEKNDDPVRIAIAKDKAFCFYYEDSLNALREMGAELVSFSPVNDASLPEDIDGLYLGGGYPELYEEKLSSNVTMKESILKAVSGGLPTIAECGGFMYLTEDIDGYPMVGLLKGSCRDTGKLTRFGYVTLHAQGDNMLTMAGGTIAAHEFHHWDCEFTGADFKAKKPSGREWECVFATDTLYAGFPHFHFYANLDFARNFYNSCLKEKHKND